MKIALIQMKVGMDKDKNLEKARRMVLQAGREGARIAVLPEMFCCPYESKSFPLYAEAEGGETWRLLSGLAARHENNVLLRIALRARRHPLA